ncbi:LAQU0S01e09076g1_1 [Lachancea quebecensis]|uniref:Spindle pole body component SPC42 n=1 Tax=Lachancea quebecensis TaxID=1654605 RepID=A0A0P1KLI7_9SACH|nr:LAQU0S01e09076g1_1 [Lachancea quebecensis]
MNISPTPKRYNSRGYEFPRSNDEAFHPFNREPPMVPSERILPEEYRVNSQMINKLIKQNKDLTQQLDRKQDEIDRLNVLVGSLRGKLIKYTELNKKLEQTAAGARQSSPDDVLQVNRTRPREPAAGDPRLDDRLSDLYSKLETLTELVAGSAAAERGVRDHAHAPSSGATRTPSSGASVFHRPLQPGAASEDDILTQESAELKGLEDQIDLLKRKLLIKRENELRKLSLNKELLDLMEKLDVSRPAGAAPSSSTPPHCDQCHKATYHTAAANGGHGVPAGAGSGAGAGAGAAVPSPRNPPYMSMAQVLETPTPAHRSGHKPNDTLW